MLTSNIIEQLELIKRDLTRLAAQNIDSAIEEITAQSQLLEAQREFISEGHGLDRRFLQSLDEETMDLFRRYFGRSSEDINDALDQMFPDDREDTEDEEELDGFST